MTGIDVKSAWADAQATNAKLSGCVGPHDFVDASPERKIAKDYICSRCGGRVSATARYWYERGLRHGRGVP